MTKISQLFCMPRTWGLTKIIRKRDIKPTTHAKWEKVSSKLKVIKKTKLPRNVKTRLAVGAGLSIKTYGVACALASKDDYRSMRPRVAAAALRSGAGVSSWLACNAYDTRLDPLFRDTIDAINAWRRYIKIFPYRLKAIHNSMVSHGSRKGPGPLARLTGILKDISWVPVANKTGFLTNGTIHLDWTTTPMKTIKTVLLQGWSEMVANQCNHRKFFDIDSIDIPLTQKIYHKQGYKEQALLDQVITGKSFTIDELRYYDSNQHAACPLCGCSDSRHHRLFQCSSARHIRNKYSTSVQFARKQNKAWWYHCLMPWPKEVTKHWNFLSTVEIIFSLPEQTLQRKTCFHGWYGLFWRP